MEPNVEPLKLNPEALNVISDALQKQYGFATTSQLDKAVADIIKRAEARGAAEKQKFSMSRMIRGLRAMRGDTLVESTKEEDIAYVRALDPGATPGSYLVPTIQANEIIEYLTLSGVARAAGVRIWDLGPGIQNLNVPTATATPTWAWVGQNTSTAASDPNLGQLAFQMKERRALVLVPNQLINVSRPAYDMLLSELLGIGAAEHEDTAMFGTTSATNGPTSLYAAASTGTLLVGGSANGGNLAYSDITATLAKAAAAKAKGPFVWFASPRTFYNRLLGLIDLSSRPLMIPTLTQGLLQGAQNLSVSPAGMLMGYPVFVTPYILENISNGSGTNQSYLVLTNPKYIHIAQNASIEIAVSTERYFEFNQTGIRALNNEDFAFGPPAGITILKGIN